MTTIRVKHYLEDQDSDDLTASGAAYAERARRKHHVDNTVKIRNTEILDKAQEGASEPQERAE